MMLHDRAVYGMEVIRSVYRPVRDGLAVETTSSGNVVVRCYREDEPMDSSSVHQHGHIVLTPMEATQLACELIVAARMKEK